MIKRRFLLGDKWLYFKLYCGVRTADTILEEVVFELTQVLLKKKLISSWFFIRYSDPDPHIRLRLKIREKEVLGAIIDDFNKIILPYLDENLVWNIQMDCYMREIERYGANTMELCEDLFFYDSQFITKVLAVEKDEELYFFQILKSVSLFVSSFGFDEKEILEFYKENASAYKQEFGIGKVTKLSLDKKYRASTRTLNTLMSRTVTQEEPDPLMILMNQKNESIKPLIKKLIRNHKKGALEVPLKDLVGSCVHMSVNRAFRNQQRFYELLIYDFLARHQNSKINKR